MMKLCIKVDVIDELRFWEGSLLHLSGWPINDFAGISYLCI